MGVFDERNDDDSRPESAPANSEGRVLNAEADADSAAKDSSEPTENVASVDEGGLVAEDDAVPVEGVSEADSPVAGDADETAAIESKEDVEVSGDKQSTADPSDGLPLDVDVDEDDVAPAWYILKVQVNREDSIRDALLRRVKIEGLEEFFLDVVVPTEDVVEFTKSGKRRVVKRKLYPGYILANMVINDETWFVVRETPGVGDFTGSAGKPTPMDPKDVERILRSSEPDEEGASQPKTAIPFKPGERVRVKDGNFQNFEGEVESIDETHGRVIVVIQIFSRPTPVELEHWQIEAV